MIHGRSTKNNIFLYRIQIMTKIKKSTNFSIIIENQPVPYNEAIYKMQRIVDEVMVDKCNDTVWLLEHFPIYTAGYTTFNDWIDKYGRFINGIELIETGRGGKITFHGPGQRICYLIIDLKKIYGIIDLTSFLSDIHQLIIEVLSEFKIEGLRDKNYPGVWVRDGDILKKIAAIGIKVSKGVSYHGFALNVNTDMRFFDLIEPCGISDTSRGVTSISNILGFKIPFCLVDEKIQQKVRIFSKNTGIL